MQNMLTIYVLTYEASIDEYRPTQAIDLGDGLYKLLPTPNYEYDPEDEDWQFLPEAIVKGEMRKMSNGQHCLVAAEQVSHPTYTVPIQMRYGIDYSQIQKVQMISLGKNIYQLAPADMDRVQAEHWEFMPGDVVRCAQAWGKNGLYGLLAVERVQ